MATDQPTCEDTIDSHLESRMDDIRQLWQAELDGNEDGIEDLGTLNDYGLDFGYVAPDTFDDQPEGYFRWQLSWGGPSDEIRFYTGCDFKPYKILYHFMDWFDGAKRYLRGSDLELIHDIWQSFFCLDGDTEWLRSTIETDS